MRLLKRTEDVNKAARKQWIIKERNMIDEYLYKDYGVFKLTPRECLRLMAVDDPDIDKMMEVNSNTQCYKQAGNSIVVSVLMGLFSQLNIKGVTPWNDMSEKDRYKLIYKREVKE